MSTPTQAPDEHVPNLKPEETPEGLTPHTSEIIEETLDEAKASEEAMRTAVVLFLFVVIFTGLLSAVYLNTKPTLEASAAAETLAKIEEVLPAAQYNNALLADTLTLDDGSAFGQKDKAKVYRARLNGKPSALVAEVIAPDGYAGKIRFIMAVSAEQKLLGIRVVEHKETPGLGDYIEPRKDKNRQVPWISQFANLALDTLDESTWKVKKDGGQFDYRTGATVTPRAIVKALGKAQLYIREHWHELFVTPQAAGKTK